RASMRSSGRRARSRAPARPRRSRRASSHHGEATGDRQRLTGDESGVVGREKDDGRRDVVRHAEPTPGNHARETVREFRTLLRELLAEQRRVGRARTHAVDVDTMARDLAGDGLGERDEPALRRGVHSLAGGADASGGLDLRARAPRRRGVDIGDGHARALTRQRVRDGETDAAGPAGDEGHTVLQLHRTITLAMMSFMISLVPPPMVISRASRAKRSTAYSRM